ncbi:MAG: ABC transporter permease [Anaerolineales bacterium]|nr:ABC transporter permease [Anaerolineales bacterium]MCK4975539.1 ABC transporter permease [Anaerolineales bacterium]MCK5314177.1 ABC transporter permease [Anaerolineales bacterium]MCK5429598.1 ABC transporter permease [Anaerolineales bacterium]
MKAVKVLERALATIPIMFGVAIIVFLFIRLTPGDPVDIMMGQGGAVSAGEIEQLRSEFNLDEPLLVQLWLFLKDAIRGDLGYSYILKKPVTVLIAERLPATIELALGALFFSLIIALPIGILSAVKQNSLIDRLSMTGAFLGISMPGFWLAIILIMFFSVYLHWLPVQGRIDYDAHLQVVTGFYVLDSVLTRNKDALISSIKHLILPSIALGAAATAVIARVLRSGMLETLRSDYVTLARSKGAPESSVVLKHALRNALIPTVTVVGLQVGILLGGNMIIETVFGWPGLGSMVVNAIFNRDFPLIQGSVMIYAFVFVMASLIVDILYTYLNPKITL